MTSDDRPMADQPRPDDDPAEPDDQALMAMARRGRDVLDQADPAHVASLWDGIAAAVLDDADEPTTTTPAPDAVRADLNAATPSPEDQAATSAHDDNAATPAGGEVVDLDAARRRRGIRWLAGTAAAALVLVVLAGTWVVTKDTTPDPIASFALDALDDRAAAVDGEIVDDGGQTRVEVDLAGLDPSPDGTFYELWLLDAESGRLVSLGPVEDQTSFVVPASVDVGDWPLLDVSVEPVDGDPTHSSDSILRGEIIAAPQG